MNRLDFTGFVYEYCLIGIIIGIILSMFFYTLLADHDSSSVYRFERRRDFFLALQGRKINESDIQEFAQTVRKVILEKPLNERLSFLLKIERSDNSFKDLLVNKYKGILELVRGESGELIRNLKKPEVSKWQDYLIVLYFIVVTSALMQFAIVSIEKGQSLFQWPWRRLWIYPVIIYLSPVLIFFVALEIIIRIFFLFFYPISLLLNREFNRELNKEKKKVLERIKGVKKRTKETEEKWLNLFLGGSEKERLKLESKISLCNNTLLKLEKQASKTEDDEKLSRIGQKIGSLQFAHARYSVKLKKLTSQATRHSSKTRDDYLRDLRKILKHPEVVAVDIDDTTLEVYIKTVYIYHFFIRREIGIFLVKINLRYVGRLEVENLCTTNPNGDDHPYGSSGGFCFGALGSSIREALDEREFFPAVCYIIQGIHSVLGDSFMTTMNWKGVSRVKI